MKCLTQTQTQLVKVTRITQISILPIIFWSNSTQYYYILLAAPLTVTTMKKGM